MACTGTGSQFWPGEGWEEGRDVTDEGTDAAMQAFILEVIVKHAPVPNSKFLLMVRRPGPVHSMITRKVTYRRLRPQQLTRLPHQEEQGIEVMNLSAGGGQGNKCLPVYYERWLLYPRRSLKLILDFLLGIAWSDAVLHHEDLIGKPGGASPCPRLSDPQTRSSNP
ncbi:Protein-tyrosine sulfotransferase 2 [Camelus dromedarius]|uniref:Protein-tyrosine sulfotransferase n=1 Tax=Camelus dromedarius TaxID=9838 RepID=A0A5N4C848_CAMDR|nr:Protein-tyrosine sulfotransferase 2 [Camelus dromedarius]